MTDSLTEAVHRIVSDVMAVPHASICPASDLHHDLGATDLDKLQIIMELEDEYDFEVDDDHLERLKTVGDLIAYFAQRLGAMEVAA